MSVAASNPWQKQAHKSVEKSAAGTDKPQRKPESLPNKIKKLSNIAAIACFISVLAVGFGIWGIYTSVAENAATEAGTKNVLVATTTLAKGQSITADSVEIKAVPADLQVEGCLDESQLEAVVGTSTSSQILSGMQLTSSNVSGIAGASTLASALDPGMTAITITVDSSSGICGLISIGDYVSVVKPGAATSGTQGISAATTLVEKTRVVALDSSISTSSATYTNVTLEVSAEDALRVRQAQFSSSVSLILLSETEGGEDSTVSTSAEEESTQNAEAENAA
jgi:pilus assembly protein CpaB